MSNLYKDVSPGDNAPEEINVVVEITKGSPNKYEYDEDNGYITLDRVIYSSVYFPFEYGFMPQTLSEDGDPLDIVLLSTHPSIPGCVVKARPIGILLMEDEAGEDNKIIAVPVEKIDPRFKDIKSEEDLSGHQKSEIQEFFETYKRLEPGKFVKIKGWGGKEKAVEIINKSLNSYNEE